MCNQQKPKDAGEKIVLRLIQGNKSDSLFSNFKCPQFQRKKEMDILS